MTCKTQRSMIVACGLTILAVAASGIAAQEAQPPDPSSKHLKPETRLELITRAQVWMPTDVESMDLRTGPTDVTGFQPNETVNCTYVSHQREGNTPKFYCLVNGNKDDEVKVKYGQQNGEVYGEVLATRLLWAMGFGADRVYPARVACKGCSADPWKDAPAARSEWTFAPASIERTFPAKKIETKDGSGWKWSELDLVDEAKGGAPKAQRDALKLVAVLIQHSDTKPQQQRLVCLPGGHKDEGESICAKPFMLLNDVGVTFGEATLFNGNNPSSVNFEKWSKTPVWKKPDQCIGDLKKSATGTLDDPRISEEGRAFLASLLTRLSDQQLHDLFDVARVELRSRKPGGSEPPATVDEWVDAFKLKRDEIVTHHCPPGAANVTR